MKILNVKQIREGDNYTIQNLPILSIDLAERAADACLKWLLNHYGAELPNNVKVFCGTGNNGGDGLAIARMLTKHVHRVEVYLLPLGKESEDFKINLERIKKTIKVRIKEITDEAHFPKLRQEHLVIDAILGSGLNRAASGIIAKIIQHINHSKAEIIAIDSPSGLFSDFPNQKEDAIIEARHTLTFESPKLSFLFDEHYQYVGDWHRLHIGIHPWYIRDVETKIYRTDFALLENCLKKRKKVSHKGTFGHALLIGGSYGRVGAALLAGSACLRSGVGLLTAYLPECAYIPFQTALPEAMVMTDSTVKNITHLPEGLEKFDAIGVGHGLGQEVLTAKMLHELLLTYKKPMVIDADALNIIAANPTWFALIPENSILTPHKKEFERLFGQFENPYSRFEKQKEISQKYRLQIVYKGANTCITLKNGITYFNGTGNAGMATAGSGDVLMGILTALLAQGYDAENAAIFGVFLHGLAGDLAATKFSQEAMIASDIVRGLGKAFKVMRGN